MTSPNRIRMAFLVPHTGQGGAETMISNLFPYLPSDRFDLFLIAPQGQPLIQLGEILSIEHVAWQFPQFPSTSFYWRQRRIFNPFATVWMFLQNMWLAIRIASCLRRQQIDYLYSASTHGHLINGFACLFAPTKAIWHFQEIVSPQLVYGLGQLIMRRLAQYLTIHIVAASQAIADGLDLPHKTIVIFNSVDLAKFQADAPIHNILLTEYELTEDVPLVGVVGRLTRWKGQKIFLDAAQKVLQQGHSCHFFIVGSAMFDKHDFRAELETYAEKLGIGHIVVFTGQRTDIPAIMHALDVVVVPSIEPEPFGMVAVEAMAAGKSVIGSDAGGLPEIIVSHETGLLFPCGDSDALAECMRQLIKDAKLRQTYGENGRQRVQQYFSAEQSGQEFVQLLLSLTDD